MPIVPYLYARNAALARDSFRPSVIRRIDRKEGHGPIVGHLGFNLGTNIWSVDVGSVVEYRIANQD